MDPITAVFGNKALLARILAFSILPRSHLDSFLNEFGATYVVCEEIRIWYCDIDNHLERIFFVCKQFFEISKFPDFWRKMYKLLHNRNCSSKKLKMFVPRHSWQQMFTTITYCQNLDNDLIDFKDFYKFVRNMYCNPYLFTFYTHARYRRLGGKTTCVKRLRPDDLIREQLELLHAIADPQADAQNNPQRNFFIKGLETNILITLILVHFLTFEWNERYPFMVNLFKQFVLHNIDYFIYDLVMLNDYTHVLPLNNLYVVQNEPQSDTEPDLRELYNAITYVLRQNDISPYQIVNSFIAIRLCGYDFIDIDLMEKIYQQDMHFEQFIRSTSALLASRAEGILAKYRHFIVKFNVQRNFCFIPEIIEKKGCIEFVKLFYELGFRGSFKLSAVRDQEIIDWLHRLKKITIQHVVVWRKYTTRQGDIKCDYTKNLFFAEIDL